nr:recombinase RecT [uncultured Lichenicoccus sp.]
MNAVTTRAPTNSGIVPVLQPQTFQELVRFAEMAASSDLMPPNYKGKPANIMLAVQMGSELGLSPMQAIQNIAVIQGRPAVWGDALLGLVRKDQRCKDVAETLTGEGEARVATCIVKRAGSSDVVRTFSVADARRAGLWDKQGPWKQYPDRMLQMRARGFACRDAFPDVLRGLISAEEAADTPRDDFRGVTIQSTAEPAAAPPAATAAPQPVDHVAIIQRKVAACTDAECVTKLGTQWMVTMERAKAAGRPIAEDVHISVTDLLADALGRFEVSEPDYGEMADESMPA